MADQNQSDAAYKFWDAFKACVEENRVRPDHARYYINWAKAFVDFLPNRLRDRSRQDIQAFLMDLAKRPGIVDWQVRQAEHALKILYETFLPAYADEKAKSLTTTTPKSGRFSDRAIPGEAERLYPKAAASEWIWQYIFPANGLSVDPQSGMVRRHHIHENLVKKAVKKASSLAGIDRKVSCQTLRHSFATHYDLWACSEQAGTFGPEPG
jgi:hypothetical protein